MAHGYNNLLNSLFKKYLHITLITLILILSKYTTIAEPRRHSPLLVEDDGARRNNRPAVSECQFGKTLRELGSTWYADLGPPFGVMYCIKCECVAVPKKRRIVARVQCRNIKNECPPALCDDPILLPGKCCKTCPGDNSETEIPQDVPVQVSEEEERNMKHFAALLTGRTSYFLKREEMKSMYTTNNPQNIIATGRFTFHKKNLYYSFYISRKIIRPRAIQFIDDFGTIVEEHNLQTPLNGPMSIYQNTTGKICGVWRRVPREYKRLLRDERLNVVLLWGGKYQAELAIGGRIGKYPALSTELFTTLLEPPQTTKTGDQLSGAGGTAIVSTTTGAASSVHMTLVFNGIFNPDEFLDAPVNIRIEWPDRKEIILDEVQKVRKPSHEINILEISSPISIQNLRLLSRGKLMLTVESRKNPHLKIQGHVMTRTTCELFQSLLSPTQIAESPSEISGLAWIYMNTDGSLVYNIQTDKLDLTQNPQISLVEDNSKRKTALEDLTHSFNYNQAIGTIEKLGPRVLESLYAGELAVNVGIQNEPSVIRGRLISRPVADSRDSGEPILLKRPNIHASNSLVGMAWLAIDNECNLHYEIVLNGFSNNQQPFQIYLEEKPIEAINAPITRKLLEEFAGSSMEGFVLGMPSHELVKLETSVCYLEIYSKETKDLLLRGKLKSTKVPSHCFPLYTDNNVPSVIVPGDHNDNHLLMPDTKCYYSGRFYDEAEQWKSSQETCAMCTCQHGQVHCDAIKCPNVKCKPSEELLLRENECCPTCISPQILQETNNSTPERGCQLGDEFHMAGSTWHPYLPPNGFDTCTTCNCDPETLEIRCPRIQCPPLPCSEKEAYRPDKKACCKVCPEGKGHSNKHSALPNNYLRDEESKGLRKSQAEIIALGGCKAVNHVYENGQEWHPVLASHGEQKCIKCRCKDSKVTCDRKRCTRAICTTIFQSKRKGIPLKDSDECCTQQCRRNRRHQKHKNAHKDREQPQTTFRTTNTHRS